jgi:hypothetical protein
VPWAWGIKRYASVVPAILATLLAMPFGTRVVMLVAAALYVAAGRSWAGSSRAPQP